MFPLIFSVLSFSWSVHTLILLSSKLLRNSFNHLQSILLLCFLFPANLHLPHKSTPFLEPPTHLSSSYKQTETAILKCDDQSKLRRQKGHISDIFPFFNLYLSM